MSNPREVTTKHTKSTKGIARESQPSIADLFLRVKLTSRLEGVAAQAVPPKMQFFVLFVCFVVASFSIGACTSEKKAPADTTAATPSATTTVAGTRIAVPHAGPPGEWQMPAGDYASSRYSTLNSITYANAGNLRTSWAF